MSDASARRHESLLARFHDLKVVVVGDVCLDRYVVGRPTRLSREAPIAVLEWEREYCLPGEASNPALNLASLGATSYLVAITGADGAAADLASLLTSRGVSTSALLADPRRCTTEKTRILAEGLLVVPQQLARIDRTDGLPLDVGQQRDLCARIEELASGADAILVSDYKRGVACPSVVECARSCARERSKLLTVDSQGDLYRFSGFDCVRCNRYEAERAIGRPLHDEADFQRELPALCRDLGCGGLVVTRDSAGLSLYSKQSGYAHVPAVPVAVADGVGAGDTVIAVLTLVLACGEDLAVAAHVANRAASLVVQHVGNACPTPRELLESLTDDRE